MGSESSLYKFMKTAYLPSHIKQKMRVLKKKKQKAGSEEDLPMHGLLCHPYESPRPLSVGRAVRTLTPRPTDQAISALTIGPAKNALIPPSCLAISPRTQIGVFSSLPPKSVI